VLYSKSSLVADHLYSSRIALAVESFFFQLRGWPLGWVPEQDVDAAGAGIPSDTKLLIVPGASHITDDALAGLRAWATSGGGMSATGRQLLLLGNGTGVLDPAAAVLRYDERG